MTMLPAPSIWASKLVETNVEVSSSAITAGPAVIAEDETSTFVSNSFDAYIDGAGSIVMERKAA